MTAKLTPHTPARYTRVALADGQTTYARVEQTGLRLYSDAPWGGGVPTDRILVEDREQLGVCGCRLLVPVEPSKIVCVGRNYRDHARELGNPVPTHPLLFLKPPSSLLASGETLSLPPTSLSQRVEHEVELAVVIGQKARRVSAQQAHEAIFGYCIVGDITARDLQKTDGQWTRAKGMDGFCPCGPEVYSGLDASARRIQCWVNDELRQDGATSDMVFSPATIVAAISEVMTLLPGDLIATGTPAGVGPLRDGDRVRMSIEGMQPLMFSVAAH